MFPYGNIVCYDVRMKRKFLHTPQRLGVVVREERQELGITQNDLAQRAGVGRRFVVELEAGHERAELGKVLAVLSALNIRPLALPDPPSVPSNTPVDLSEVLSAYTHTPCLP